ncbi:MAG: hypothetical protein LDL24_10410 [Treponema sp.]|nr:hypothetical protein [Treponema sp.]
MTQQTSNCEKDWTLSAEGTYWLSRDDLLSRWQGYALLVQRSDQQKNTTALRRIVQDIQEKRETLQRLSLIQ